MVSTHSLMVVAILANFETIFLMEKETNFGQMGLLFRVNIKMVLNTEKAFTYSRTGKNMRDSGKTGRNTGKEC